MGETTRSFMNGLNVELITGYVDHQQNHNKENDLSSFTAPYHLFAGFLMTNCYFLH